MPAPGHHPTCAKRVLFGDADGPGCACGVATREAACEECSYAADARGVAAADDAEGDGPAAAAADDRRCSICLEKFVAGQYARTLPCSHTFHVACIDEWLTTQSLTCPEDGLPVLEREDGDEGLDEHDEEVVDGHPEADVDGLEEADGDVDGRDEAP